MPDRTPEKKTTELNELYSAVRWSTDQNLRFGDQRWSQWPLWFKNLLGTAYLVIEGKAIDYASADIDVEAQTGQIVVFTSSLVVLATMTDPSAAGSQTTAQTWRRSDLQAVAVSNLQGDIFNERSLRDWPQAVRLELQYANDRKLSLPLATTPGQDAFEGLRSFYPNVLADLE